MRKILCLLLVALLLPAAALAEESVIDLNGDWYTVMLYPNHNRKLSALSGELLDIVEEMAANNRTWSETALMAKMELIATGSMILPLEEGVILGCEAQEGKIAVIALCFREENGWRAYFNRYIHAYHYEGGYFTEPETGNGLFYGLDGDVLTVFQRPENLTGTITVYNEDVFEWHYEAEEYIENGTNFGVPWMLFVRRSLVD